MKKTDVQGTSCQKYFQSACSWEASFFGVCIITYFLNKKDKHFPLGLAGSFLFCAAHYLIECCFVLLFSKVWAFKFSRDQEPSPHTT